MVVRLSFSVPEFVRIVWASETAQAVWEPRIHRVSNAWQMLERLAVVHEIKPLALQTSSPEAFPDLVAWAAGNGLCAVPLRREASARIYSNASKELRAGEPWVYRVVIGHNPPVKEFLKHWTAGDDARMGELLGFPKCCQLFFQKFWVEGKWRDLTYPMVNYDDAQNYFRVNGPRGANILLRWVGIRMVSHLPCKFDCVPSGQIGEQMLKLFRTHFREESSWLEEMIDWPIRWSSLHGVAIITTPVMKIVTSSDPLCEMVNVDRDGAMYPAEGASGVDFPFKNVVNLRSDNWSDNGFSNFRSMEDAHSKVIEIIARSWEPSQVRILDLGCGNGLLLSKLASRFPYAQIEGIEINRHRYERADHRLKGFGKVTYGDIMQSDNYRPPYGLVLISNSRLTEISVDDRDHFIEFLADVTEHLLIYTYNGADLTDQWWSRHFVAIDTASAHAILLRSKHATKQDRQDSSGS